MASAQDRGVLSEGKTFVPSERCIEHTAALGRQDPRWDDMWSQMGTTFKVRDKNYLSDGQKIPSKEPIARLLRCDLLETSGREDHIMSKLAGTSHDVVAATKGDAHLLVINFQLPACSGWTLSVSQANISFVMYLALPLELAPAHRGGTRRPEDTKPNDEPACSSLVRRFLAGETVEDHSFCDARFKILPCVIDGPWAVQKVVGNTPAILGNKVKQRYFRGNGYLEVAVDIGSSSVATHIFSAVRRFSTSVVLDLGFVIQGEDEDELPERVLGGVRLMNVDLSVAEKLECLTA